MYSAQPWVGWYSLVAEDSSEHSAHDQADDNARAGVQHPEYERSPGSAAHGGNQGTEGESTTWAPLAAIHYCNTVSPLA